MKSISTRRIVLNGIMIALVFLATYMIKIPAGPGYVNIGDAAIMIVAVILGKNTGLIAGAVGSCLADIFGGYFIYAPVTFIVKGIEGYVIGIIAARAANNNNVDRNRNGDEIRLLAIIAGAVVMIVGYFLAEAFVLGFIDEEFGIATAVGQLFPNFVQGSVTAVIGYFVSTLLLKNGIQKHL